MEPPPRKGDMLFRDDLSDAINNACLNTVVDDHFGYIEGYRGGAYRLVQHVIETGCDQECFVYPIVFLYRHHIELVLKRIIRRAPYLIKAKLSPAETRHLESHRLDVLWQDLKPLLSAMVKSAGWKPLEPEDVEGVNSYIRQLMQLDPDSYRFRYVRTKKGDLSLPSGLERINLRHFAEMMERLASYLTFMDHATENLEDMKAEMEAECWRNSDCA